MQFHLCFCSNSFGCYVGIHFSVSCEMKGWAIYLFCKYQNMSSPTYLSCLSLEAEMSIGSLNYISSDRKAEDTCYS